MEKKNNYMVPALEKGLMILEKLARSEEPLRITDVHEQMGIPKTSVFMILTTLEKLGYVDKVDENRYRATMKIYNIGLETLDKYDIRRVARPFMEKLAEELRFTVHLAVLSNGLPVYIEKVNGPSFVQFNTYIGQVNTLHASAVGKVLAAYMTEEQLMGALELNPLERLTDNTITSPEAFRKFLTAVRDIGYAIEDEEGETGVRCIGSPIFNDKGKVIAALSVTAVRGDMQSDHFQDIGSAVKRQGELISQQLGFMH